MSKIGTLSLKCHSESIAEVKIIGLDQPWHIGKFYPFEEFNEHRKIFSDLEREYRSGSIRDWEKFFAKTTELGYSLSNGSYSMQRYTLLWDGGKSDVRLRGTLVKVT